jgi:hypothetical protein
MPDFNDLLKKFGGKPQKELFSGLGGDSSRPTTEGFYNAGRSSDFESGYQNFLYKNQFFGEGALKAIGGGAIDGLLGAAEGIVNFPKIFTKDWEKNGLQQGISDVRESWKDIIKLAHPSDSEGHFDDMGDFWEGLQSAVSSGIEFAIPGGIISKTVSGIGKVASTIGKAALKLNTTAKAIRTAEILGKTGWESAGEVTKWLSYIGENQVASRIGSAVMSNLHEGTVMGLQKYEEVKKKAYEDFKQIGLSDEESLIKAKGIAAQAAEDVVDANKYFWVSNLITLSPFFKGATEVTNPSLLKSLSKEFADFGDAVKNKKYANLFNNGITGAVGEGLQEMIQNVIEHSAENTANKTIDSILTKAGAEKKYNAVDNDFGSYVDRFFSKDALYEGIIGFGSAPIIGGAGKLINNKIETNFTINPAFAKFEKATGLKMTERNYESAIQSADDEIKNLQKNLTKENSIKIKEIEEAKSELEDKLLNTQVGAYDVSQSFDVADTVTQVMKNFKSLTTDIAGVDDSTQQVAKDNEFYKLVYRARRLGKLDEIKDQIQSTDDKVTSTQLLEKIDKFEKISSYNSGKFFGDILTGNQITRDIYFDYKNRNNTKINELLTKIGTQLPGITANYTDGNFTFTDKDGNNVQLNDQQSELVRNIKSDNDNIYTLDAANKATDVKLNHTLKTDAIYRSNETERIFKSAVSNLQNNPEKFIDDYNKFINFEKEDTSKLEKEIKKQEFLLNDEKIDDPIKERWVNELKENKVKLANLKDKNSEIQTFRANILKPYKDLYDVKEFQKEIAKKAAEQSVEVTDSTINFEDLTDTFDINDDNPNSEGKDTDIKENVSSFIKFGNEVLEVVGDSSVINLGQEFGTIVETLPNEQGINKVSKTKNNGIQVNGFFNGKTVTIKKETYKSGGIEDKTSYNIYITTKDGEFYIGKLKTDKIPDELLNILNTQNVETQLIVDSKYRIETGKETSFDDFLNKHKEKQSNVKFKVISVNEKNEIQTLLNGNIEGKVGKHNIVNYDTFELNSNLHNVPHILLNVGNHPDTGEPVYYAKMLKFKQQKLHTDLAKTLNNIFFVLYSLKMSDKENLPKRFAIYKKLIDNGFVDVSHLEKESALLKDFLSKYNADTTSAEEIEAFLNEFKPSILYYQTYIHTFLKTYKTSEQPTDKNFILQLLPATAKSPDGFERILVTNTENGKKYAITFNGDPSTVEKFFKENGPSDWEKMFSNLRLPFLRPGEIKTVPILSEELPIGKLDAQDINTFAWLTDLNGEKKEQLVFPVIGVRNVNQVDPINNLGIAKRNKENSSEYITPQGPATRSSVYLNGESNGKQSAAMNAGTIVDSLFKSLFAGLTFQQAYDKLTNDVGLFPMNVAEKIFNALNDKKLNFGNNTKIITKTKEGNDLTFIYKTENQLVAGELDAILEHTDPKTGLKTYSILDLKTSKKDTPDLENYRKQQEFFALAIKEYLNLDYIPEMYIAYAQVEYDKIDTPKGEDVNSGTLSIKKISTHKIEPVAKQTEVTKNIDFTPVSDFDLKKGDILYNLYSNTQEVANTYKVKAFSVGGEGSDQYLKAVLLVDIDTKEEKWWNSNDKFNWNNLFKKLDSKPEQTENKQNTQSEIEAKKAEIETVEKEKQKTLKPLIEKKEQIEKEIKEIERNTDSREEKGKRNNIVPISTKEAERLLKHLSKKYGILGILTDLLPEFTYGKFTTEKILINKNTYYDEKGDITFEPKGFVNKITIYHEYLHPFVQIIERYNPELYEKIYQESLNSDIDVSHYIKDVRKEERIVRYLDKLSAQEKVPSLLQQFFDFLSDLFYRNKKSNYKTIQKLNKNTTINELFAIFKNYGALSEEAKGIKEERFLKLEKTQLENLIRLNAGDIENHKKELEIIIQKLHTLERYDVNNLDQLKQQLAEVNKKIDEVTKRFDAQIAQKQSELKELEEIGSQPKTETLLPNLIYGTPGIGKTTYVTENKDKNIADVDDLLVKHSNSKDIEEFKAKSPNLSEKERADIYQKVINEIANNPTITYFTGSKKLIPYADKLYLKNTKEQRKFVDDKFKQEEQDLINEKSIVTEIQDKNKFLSDVLTENEVLQNILNNYPHEITVDQLLSGLANINIKLEQFLNITSEQQESIILDIVDTFDFPEIEPVVTYFELYPGVNPELQTKVLLELTSIFPRNTLEMSKLYDLYLTILESNFKYYEENNINYDHLKPLLNTTKDTFVNAYKQIAKEQFGFTFEDENFEKQLSEDIQNFDDYGSLTKLTLDKLKGNLKFKLQKNVLFVPIKKYSENSPESKYPLLGIRESTSDFDLFMTMIENIFTNVRPDSKSKMELLKNHPDAAVRRLYDYLEKNENVKNGLITLFDHYEGAYKIVEYDKNFNTKVIPINTARMAEKLFFKTIDDFFNSGYFTYSDKLEDRVFDKKTASEDISYLIKALENIPRTEYDTLLEEYDELQATISKIISSPSKEERDTLPAYQKRRKELKNKIDSVSDLVYQKRLDNYLSTKHNNQFVSDLVEDFFTKKLGLTLHKNAITVLATSSQFGSKKNKRFGLSDFLYELSNYTKGENPLTETAFRNAETKGMFFYEKSFLRFAINEQIKYTAISGSRVIKSGDRPISTQLAHNNISRVIRDYTGLDEYSLENMQKALKSRFKKRSLLLKSLIEYFTQLKNSPTAKEDMTKFLSVIPFSLEPLKRENSSRQNKNKELDKLSEEELMFIEKAMFFDQNWPSFSSPTLSDKKTKYIIHSAWLKRIWKEYSVNVKTLNGVTYPIDFLNLLFDEQLNAELDRYLYNNSKKAKEKKNSFFYINEYLNYSFLENNPNKELIISLYRQETGEDIVDLIGNNQEKILNTHFIWNNVNGNKVLNTDLANPNSKAYKLARIIFEVEFINHSNKEQSLSKQYSTHAEIAYRLNKLSLVQLIHGDPANAFKNAKNDIDIVKETLINYEKRLAKDNASGTPYVYDEDPNDVIRILPINDLKLPVNDLDKRLEVLNGKETMDKLLILAEKAEITKNFVSIYKSSKGLKRQIALANILKNSSKELTKNIIGLEYASVNTTDAGSFITPGFALKKLFRSGKISKLFYDNAIEAFNNDPYSFNLVNFIKTSSNLRSAELTAKNISPEKPITVGEIQDNLIEDVRSYYEKEAEFLLDPTELASTPILQKIYELLINSGADKAAPPSAIKLGVEDVNLTFDINEDGEIEIVDEVIIEPIEVHWKYYNKQVETPIDEESETEITTVTQIMTQIISNVDPKNKKLVSKYLKNVRELYDLKKEALKNNLLIPGSNTVDRRKLAEYIKKLADKKILRISDNALFHLFQIKNNKFETPLYALDEKSYMEISGALNAMLRKELKTHLFTGSANYLRPDVGITKTNLYDSVDKFQGDISYISGYELQEDGLQPNEMIISWDYVDSLGNRVPIEDFLNKDGTLSNRFPRELLETLSMRIPNTGHNSTSVMKIVGFTKQANTVITHNSLIAQMGSDFDIDKLYSYIRPFTYIDKDLKPLTKSNLHQFVNEPKYELLKIKAVERDIIDSMVDIMDLPEIQRETMIPLNFGKLKDIADNTVENKATFLSSKYDRENYLNSTGAKTMVGIFANSLSFYTVLEQNDKKLKLFKKNKEGEPIDFEFYINGIKTNGTLGLTNTLSNPNRKVTTVLKSMLQSAVDNQKENILGKLNINKHTASVINLLAYLGYEEDAIVSIINKPIIREFVTDLNNKKSIFSKEALSDSKILSEKIKTLENILKTETDNKDNHDFYRKIENDLSELKKYAYLLSYADDLQEITIGVNIFSKGVPLDPFDNYDQLSSFERVLSKSPFNPISPLKIYFEDEEGLGSLLKIGDDLNLLGITYENHLKESASIFNESDLYPEILNKRFVQFAEDINPYINKKAILKNIRAYVLAQKFNLAEEKPKSLTNISFIFDKLFLFQNNDYVFNVIKELKFLQNLSFTKEYQSKYKNLVYANRFDSEVLKQHRRELNTLLTNKDKIVENRFTKEPLIFDDKPLTYGDLAQELIKYAIFAEQTFSYFNVYSLLDTAILDQVGLNENFKDEVYKALYDESFEINFVANNPNLIRKADSFEDEETLKYLMINNKIQNRDGLIIQPLPVPRNSLDYQHVKNKLVDPKPTLKDKLGLMKNNKKYKSLYDLLSALQEKGIFEDLNIEVNTNSRTRLSGNTLFYNPIQEDQQTGTQYVQFIHEHLHHFLKKVLTKEFENSIEYQNVFNSFFNDKVRIGNKNQTLEEYLRDRLSTLNSQENRNEKEQNLKVILDNIFKHPLKNNILNEYLTSLVTVDQLTDELSDSPFYKKIIDHIKELLGKLFDYLSTKSARYNNFIVQRDLKPLAELYIKSNKILPEVKETLPEIKNSGNIFNQSEFSDLEIDDFSFPNIEKQQEFENFFIEQLETDPTLTETEILNQFKNCH